MMMPHQIDAAERPGELQHARDDGGDEAGAQIEAKTADAEQHHADGGGDRANRRQRQDVSDIELVDGRGLDRDDVPRLFRLQEDVLHPLDQPRGGGIGLFDGHGRGPPVPDLPGC
ncbi:MAG: hypothetical protein WDM79_11015 [Terricaulis sp.]